MSQKRQKKIAVINDFCGFGRCSIAVELPIISALKVQCCPLPTAIFSNHTAYESFFCTDFTDKMNNYMSEWKKLNLKFDGILTGFLGSDVQIEIVKSFFEGFKEKGTTVIVDPVMGDEGRLYSNYPVALAKKMSQLLPFADIITPNLTEACILTGREYSDDVDGAVLYEICADLSAMGPEKIVISGIDKGDCLENFVYEKGKEAVWVKVNKVGPCRAGTGDVFSAIIAADAVNGVSFLDSVKHASGFIEKALQKTVEFALDKADGICFEEILKEI